MVGRNLSVGHNLAVDHNPVDHRMVAVRRAGADCKVGKAVEAMSEVEVAEAPEAVSGVKVEMLELGIEWAELAEVVKLELELAEWLWIKK